MLESHTRRKRLSNSFIYSFLLYETSPSLSPLPKLLTLFTILLMYLVYSSVVGPILVSGNCHIKVLTKSSILNVAVCGMGNKDYKSWPQTLRMFDHIYL